MMRALICMTAVAMLSACSVFSSEHENIYQLHRDAHTAYDSGEDAQAEKLLLGLSRATPNDAETWFYLGNLYARTSRPDDAAQAYQKSLMLDSRQAKVWHNMGVVRVREAWAAFIQAYSVTPVDDPLHAKLENLIGAMEKIPLEGLSRNPASSPATPSSTATSSSAPSLPTPAAEKQ